MKKLFSILFFCITFYAVKSQTAPPLKNYYTFKQEQKHYFDSIRPITPDSIFDSEGGEWAEYNRYIYLWDPIMASCNGDWEVYFDMVNNFKTMGNRTSGNNEPWTELGPYEKSHTYGIGPIEFLEFFPNNSSNLSDPQYMLCGSTLGGLFFSSDGGESWINAGTDDSPEIPLSGIGSACFCPLNPNIWFAAGSGQQDSRQSYIGKAEGIYRTTDAGTNWVKIADYTTFALGIETIITKIMVNEAGIMYVSTNDGIYKSENIYEIQPTFSHINSNILHPDQTHPINWDYVYDMEFKPGDPSTIYLGVMLKTTYEDNYSSSTQTDKCVVLVSNNNGISWYEWVDISNSFVENQYNCISLETSIANPANLYVYARRKVDNTGHLWLVNSGTWNRINVNQNGDLIPSDFNNVFNYQHTMGGGHAFAVDPFDENKIWTGYGIVGAIFSYNPSDHYSVVQSINLPHADFEDIVFNHQNQNEVWVATHGGLYKTTQGSSTNLGWQFKSDGVGVAMAMGTSTSTNVPDFIAMALFHDNSVITEGGVNYYNNNPYKSIGWNPGWQSFTPSYGGDGLQTFIDPINPNYVYASGQNNNWIYNDYYGKKGIPPLGQPGQNHQFANGNSQSDEFWSTGALNLTNPDYFYYNKWEDIKRYQRSNHTTVYIPMSQQLPGSLSTGYAIRAMWVNPKKENDLYVMLYYWSDGATPKRIVLLKTTNINDADPNNVQWTIMPLPITDNTRWVKDLQFDPENPELMYLTFDSKDLGNATSNGEEMLFKINWALVTSPVDNWNNVACTSWPSGSCINLTDNLIRGTTQGLAIERGSNGGIYISTCFGIYYTNNSLRTSGTGWQKLGTGLPHVAGTRQLNINYQANVIHIGTCGRGAWEHALQCPNENNLIISDPHTNDDFQEAESILNSTAIVNPTTNVTYRAGNLIKLQSGFHATNNSYFHAFIHGCNHSGNSFKHAAILYNSNNDNEEKVLEEKEISPGYKIYPNPATETLIISKPVKTNRNETLELTDITGKVLIRIPLQDTQTSIDVKNYYRGMYFINISSDTGVDNYKFIKQ